MPSPDLRIGSQSLPLHFHRPLELSSPLPSESDDHNELATPLSDSVEASANVTEQLRPITTNCQIWVLLSAFVTICITIGFNQSYGVFQRAYVSGKGYILPPSQAKNNAAIAFIGTFGAGLTWAGSIFINPMMERVAATKYITMAGVILMSLGFGLASVSTQVRLQRATSSIQ